MKKIILCLIINMFKVYSDREPKNVISLKDGLIVSDYLQHISSEHDFRMDLRSIVNATYKHLDDDLIFQNEQNPSIILPQYLLSPVQVLDYEIDSIKRDDVELNLYTDYAYNITYSENLVTTKPKPIINYPKKGNDHDYLTEFDIIQPKMDMEFYDHEPLGIKNVVSIHNLIIGTNEYDNPKFYLFSNSFEEIYISDYISVNKTWGMMTKNLTNIIIDSNKDSEYKYIIFSDTMHYNYIFKINTKNLLEENFKVEPVMWFRDERTINHHIVDFVHVDDKFFIGLRESGILWVSQNETILIDEFYSDYLDKLVSLKVKDLQEVGNSIYVLIEDYGLKILNVTEYPFFINYEFYHPFIKSMAVHSNPNYEYFFMGLAISDRKFTEGNEFFIELSLKDIFCPKFYKIYLNNRYMDIQDILSDKSHIYLLDSNINALYVLPRTITTNDYNSVFLVHLEQLINREFISKPFMFKSSNKLIEYMGFMGTDRFTYVRMLNYQNAQINFNFNKDGKYEIQLHAYSDSCLLPIDSVKMCKVFLNYKLHIGGLPSDFEIFLKNSYYYVLGIFIVFNCILFIIYKNCYSNSLIKTVEGKNYNKEVTNNSIEPNPYTTAPQQELATMPSNSNRI